jgi:integrase
VSFLHPVTEATLEWRPGRTAESRRILAELRALPVESLDPAGFVFGGPAPWSATFILKYWRRILRKAGVRYRFPEQLRHTFASALLSRGANLLYVQKAGGWKSAAVLLRVYAKYIEQGKRWSRRVRTQPPRNRAVRPQRAIPA